MKFHIKEARESAGYSQKELAEIVGVAPNTFHGYESGKHDPKSDLLVKIATACHVTVDFLLGASTLQAVKKAPSELPEEALKIAKDYAALSKHAKGAVKAIMEYEIKDTAGEEPTEEPSNAAVVSFPKAKKTKSGIVELKTYDQPAAAGLGNYLDEPDYHIEQYPDGVIPSKTDFGIIISGDSMEPKVHNGGTVFVQASPSIDPGRIGIFVLNGQAYCKKLMVDHENRQIHLVSINKAYDDIVVGEFDRFKTIGLVLGQWTKGHKQDIFGW